MVPPVPTAQTSFAATANTPCRSAVTVSGGHAALGLPLPPSPCGDLVPPSFPGGFAPSPSTICFESFGFAPHAGSAALPTIAIAATRNRTHLTPPTATSHLPAKHRPHQRRS